MEYNKLIRDHIPTIIAQSGRQCRTETMTEDEYRQALLAKLVEEAQEVQAATPQELPTELADVLEVLDALMRTHNITAAEVRAIQQQRRQARGGFARRLRLLEVLPQR